MAEAFRGILGNIWKISVDFKYPVEDLGWEE
jgi:hypothetical protein